jgi:hypothetical protein
VLEVSARPGYRQQPRYLRSSAQIKVLIMQTRALLRDQKTISNSAVCSIVTRDTLLLIHQRGHVTMHERTASAAGAWLLS